MDVQRYPYSYIARLQQGRVGTADEKLAHLPGALSTILAATAGTPSRQSVTDKS